jgi:hypothetical protein
MKKLFIGLLIIAAGTGVFFLLQKQKSNEPQQSFQQELLTGKWKTTEKPEKDTVYSQYQYEFSKVGFYLKTLNDSSKADTGYYNWKAKNKLIWKLNATDTAGTEFVVVKLSADSLQLQTKDSLIISFTRL